MKAATVCLNYALPCFSGVDVFRLVDLVEDEAADAGVDFRYDREPFGSTFQFFGKEADAVARSFVDRLRGVRGIKIWIGDDVVVDNIRLTEGE